MYTELKHSNYQGNKKTKHFHCGIKHQPIRWYNNIPDHGAKSTDMEEVMDPTWMDTVMRYCNNPNPLLPSRYVITIDPDLTVREIVFYIEHRNRFSWHIYLFSSFTEQGSVVQHSETWLRASHRVLQTSSVHRMSCQQPVSWIFVFDQLKRNKNNTSPARLKI